MRSNDHRSLIAAVYHHASKTPDRVAFVCLGDGEAESGRATYGSLHERARRIAAELRGRGLAGERALVMLPSSIEYAEAFLGCLYGGVLAAPVYPPSNGMHAERLARVIADSKARCVITTRKVLSGLSSRFEQMLGVGEQTRYFLLDEELGTEAAGPALEPAADAIAYLQYTSGSTGDPRGVIVTHGNLMVYAATWLERFEQGERDVFVSWLPLFHDMGLIMGLIYPLFIGATSVLMPPATFLQRPLRWLSAITKYRGTASQAPNFAYDLCCDRITDAQVEALDLSSWRTTVNGAEPVRAETLARFAKKFSRARFDPTALGPGYGLAEATLGVSATRLTGGARITSIDPDALRANRFVERQGPGARQAVSCGPILWNVDARIVDPERGTVCTEGQVGEVWVKGPTVAAGYWNRPEETAETFQARVATGEGPFMRTGDLAALHQGELYITGRIKDVIIVRGQNHYPQDLEQTAAAVSPALEASRAAAFSVEVAGQERVVVAIEVKRTERREFPAEEIVRSIRSAVASSHGIDLHAVLLLRPATIQMTSSGKVQRRACKSSFLSGTLAPLHAWTEAQAQAVELAKDSTPDRTPVEALPAQPPAASVQETRSTADVAQWLVTEIAKKKKLAPAAVGRSTPFFELGLDSVDVVELTGELTDWLGRSVEPSDVFNHPNIERLSRALTGQGNSGGSEAVPRAGGQADEELAVVGMACRFPKAPSVGEYWRLLESGSDAIQETPPSRWGLAEIYGGEAPKPGKTNTRWGGFIDDVDQFDTAFFGISPREAASMDPQQRLLLATTWHALEDAGIPPASLAGTQTGVFVGVATNDYEKVQWQEGAGDDAYSGTGNASSIAANRISYVLDLRGPSWAVDTACSSSLVAMHQARQSLLQGECELAVVAGVNLMLAPDLTVVFSQAKMMAVDGRCKTFDSRADGYVRGEGCGVVILKRRADAVRDRNRVQALLAGSAVNQDGRSTGLTAPNGLAQEAVIRRALESARMSPDQIGYVEAHGTGTPLGDPIEVNALKAVYGAQRDGAPPLWIGSVKTNFGHLEAAAGIAGVIKVVLSLRNGKIPAHLHLQQLNPAIRLEGSRCAIVRRTLAWDRGQVPRAAAVSSFGFGGTNAHVILREAEPEPAPQRAGSPEFAAFGLLTISAKSPSALRGLAERYRSHLRSPSLDWKAACRSARQHRMHFTERLALVTPDAASAAQLLDQWLRGEAPEELFTSWTEAPAGDQVGFLFTGQGAQHVGMGRALYASHAGFRRVLDQCDACLRPILGESILDVMFAPGGEARLVQTDLAQPALFSLEYGLWNVLSGAGVAPDYLIGHSLGEYVAACAAGVFSLEDGLRLVAQRGRLMQQRTRPGTMVAVTGALDLLAKLSESIRSSGEEISIAAVNGPGDVVLSGDPDAVARHAARLADQGAKTTRLQVSRAFHSPLMAEMLEEYARCTREVTYRPARIPIVSNVTGEVADPAELADPDYWVRHVMKPVLFARGVETLVKRGCGTLVELGPHPVLTALGRGIAPGARWIATLRRNGNDPQQLATCLAAWYAAGRAVDWRRFDGDADPAEAEARPVELPSYVFDAERHWVAKGVSARSRPSDEAGELHPLIGRSVDFPDSAARRFEARLSLERLPDLACHQVLGSPVLPAAAMVEAMLAAQRTSGLAPQAVQMLEEVSVRRPVVLAPGTEVLSHLVCEPVGERLRIRCFARSSADAPGAWVEFASCFATGASSAGAEPSSARARSAAPREESASMEKQSGWYDRLDQLGLQYTGPFRSLKALWRTGATAIGEVELPSSTDGQDELRVPALLDGCFQTLVAFLDPSATEPWIPVAIERVILHRTLPDRIWVRAEWRGEGAERTANLELVTDAGEPILSLRGLRLAAAGPATFARAVGSRSFDLYRLGWRATSFDAAAPLRPAAPWLLVCEEALDAASWRRRCDELDLPAVTITLGDVTQDRSLADHQLDGTSEEACAALFSRLAGKAGAVAGMVYLAATPPVDEGEPVVAFHRLARRSFLPVRAFLQSAQVSSGKGAALVLCSRGAYTLGATNVGPVAAQSALSGIARAAAAEVPTVSTVQLDLDSKAEVPPLDTLLRCALQLGGSGLLACRDGQWFTGEVESAVAGGGEEQPAIRADASYLVTGGTGGLGLALAEWLARLGARTLVLTSRSAGDRGERIAALERSGVRVELVRADVSRPADCRAILAGMEGLPPLRGVFHAAGVLDDGAMAQLDWSRFEKVLEPKVNGAWNLHRLTADRELDHFVLFSSLASLVGSAGQASYVAANAFLDALAHLRRGEGRAALSVNWGPWAEVGMAARGGLVERLARSGVIGLAPDDALQALGRLMADGGRPAQVGIARIDWGRYRQSQQGQAIDTLLARLVRPAPLAVASAGPAKGAGLTLEALAGVPAEAARDAIVSDLLARVARVLRLDDAGVEALQPRFGKLALNELGLDSLMAVELRNRILNDLTVDVPIHYFVGGSTASDVVDLIHSGTVLKQMLSPDGVTDGEETDQEVYTI